MQPLVNFVIAGVQKGGTTALAQFLSAHPQICMAPVKEVHFFDYYFGETLDRDRYHSYFPNYAHQPLVGEATPIYLYFPWIAPRLQAYNPNLKAIVLLRHPVDRAYSHYQMERGRGWETLSFSQAIRLEPLRILRDRLRYARQTPPERCSLRAHSYSDRGFYSRQLLNWWRYFPRDRTLVLFNDDLQQRHAETLERVYRFLGVEVPSVLPSADKVLVGNYDRPMLARDRDFLLRKFQVEIDRLQALLGVDLKHWQE